MKTNRAITTISILLAAAATLLPVPPGPGMARAEGDLVLPRMIQSSMVAPVYPEPERTAGIEGTVMLDVEVRSDGTIAGIKAEEQVKGHPAFTASAIAAVEKWRFEPARRDDKPVACSVRIPVRFALDCKKKK
jgi:periplasmic protein TonB